jgi:hypothetical protein
VQTHAGDKFFGTRQEHFHFFGAEIEFGSRIAAKKFRAAENSRETFSFFQARKNYLLRACFAKCRRSGRAQKNACCVRRILGTAICVTPAMGGR